MKFTIEKAAFLDVLAIAAAVAEKRSTIAVLENVLIRADKGAITIAATDLNVSVSATLPATVDKKGAITLKARQLAETVSGILSEQLTVTLADNNYAEIVSVNGKRKPDQEYKMLGLSADDFPKMSTPLASAFIPVPPTTLARMFKRTAFAMSTDQNRLAFNGMLFENDGNKVRVVAIDGHRLVTVTGDLDGLTFPAGSVVTRKGIEHFRELLHAAPDAAMTFTDKHAYLRVRDVVVGAQLTGLKFVEWSPAIPQGNENTLTATTKTLVDAAKRVGGMSDSLASCIRCDVDAETCLLSAESMGAGVGKESVEVKYEGTAITFAFNPKYLADMGTAIDAAGMIFEIAGLKPDEAEGANKGKPVMLTPIVVRAVGDDSFIGVLMPARL